MATCVEERGYRSTSVADVVRIARTSRRTFYEHFDDRDACFLALFEAATGDMMRSIAAAVQFDAEWEALVDAAVGAYLDSVAARPALFESFANELPALGPAGVERARGVTRRFVELLVELADTGAREHPALGARSLQRDTAIIIVGGLRELIFNALEAHRDVSELRAGASSAVKAVLRAAMLEPHDAPRATLA
jgi:AcrR family transcriptional regulator